MLQESRPTNILIVDDDDVIREFVKLHLTSANFAVQLAEDGQAALESVKASPPDLIISDISMPNLDGFQLLEAIRGNASTAFLPFILLSQHSDLTVFRRGMELGADDFLAKPVKRADLLNSVNARLKRAERIRERAAARGATVPIKVVPPPPTTSSAIDLDGYRLIKKLGEGGMSQVFLAERADTGEPHVLKLARLGDQDGGATLQRFLAEYALVSQINHLNVARIFHQGFSDTHAYIDMEYFPNGDLRKLLEHDVPPDIAVAILIQVASALGAVHAKGIVHRDMKPDNVMMRANGSLALADFGIAKHLHAELHNTAHGEVFGTPVYIAPEQATGQEIDGRTDIYSLGAMFFELLAGRSPYQAKDAQSMLHQHVQAPLPALPDEVTLFTPLVHRMLAKRREDRPQTAYDVVRWLASHQGIDVPGKPVEPTARTRAPYNVELIGFAPLERVIIAAVLTLSLHRPISFALQTETPTVPDLFLVDANDTNGRKLLQEPDGFGAVPVVMVGDAVPNRTGMRLPKPIESAVLLAAMESGVSTSH